MKSKWIYFTTQNNKFPSLKMIQFSSRLLWSEACSYLLDDVPRYQCTNLTH